MRLLSKIDIINAISVSMQSLCQITYTVMTIIALFYRRRKIYLLDDPIFILLTIRARADRFLGNDVRGNLEVSEWGAAKPLLIEN